MRRWILPVVVVAAAAALLWRAFSGLDVHAVGIAIEHIGPIAPIVLVPFGVGMVFDAAGLGCLIVPFARRAPFARVLSIRVATEALHLSVPAGFVVGDSVTAALLDRRCRVPLVEGATIVVARRWLVMRAHTGYIVVGAIFGWNVLVAMSMRAFGRDFLPWVVLASSLVPLGLSALVGASFRPGGPVAGAVAMAARAPWAWLRDRAARWHGGTTSLDACMTRIGNARAAVWGATATFFVAWLLEACDTAVILRVLGAPTTLAIPLAAEVGISLVKSIGNVAPAGLGVQDAGYATLLPAMGLTPETAAAFVVVKRAKEAAWIAIGYALLAFERRAARRDDDSPHDDDQSVGCDGTRAASKGMHPLVNGEHAL